MAGAPFNSLPIYTAATTTAAAPPPPPPPMPEPIATSTTASIVNDIPKSNKTKPPPLTTTPPLYTCFRLLCHASRIGGVIGKSGSVVKQLQEDTSSKIRVLDAPSGSEYRVISVVADSSVNRTLSFDEESYQEPDGFEDNGEYRNVSAAQEALVRVFERILSVAAEADGCYFAPEGVVSCRLLANTNVIGSVIGRGGKVVEKIRKDTGCKISILGHERLPPCAMPADEIVEIEGGVLAVKKALVAVTRRIQDCPPPDKSTMAFSEHDNRFDRNGYADHFSPARPYNGFNPVEPNRQMDHFSQARSQGGFNRMLPNGHMDHFPPARALAQEPANYASGGRHVWTVSECVGGVIGKSGTIVRELEKQTGASINASYRLTDVGERLITITATESPESQNSPAQNAVIRVFSRSVETAYEKGLDSPSSGTPISARLVIPHYQTGCLLGKGGSIIEDMRKVTGAFIKIVKGNNFPGCTSEDDEVVLMTGEFVNVRDALYSVTGRLRNHLFTNGFKTYGRRNGQPPFEMHSSLPTNHVNQQHATLTQSMGNLRLFNNVERPSSSGAWQSQAGAGNLMNGNDFDRASTSGKSGIELGRGSRSAIITSTTVEILVPESDIGCVYGENGSNLTRLRQISGAKVVVHEPESRESDYVVVISGTPDQTQSAQSLLQAFILADQH
ncbi:hypothetical protein SSX86_005500 [Deinandra increscens subsp. villosa]|uniref:K Homology domain-containing protein n=1 Tax=Deinandra increscens subsp. villosa TaxID=3103831 RepID=A0AAP0DLM4_9ASTR